MDRLARFIPNRIPVGTGLSRELNSGVKLKSFKMRRGNRLPLSDWVTDLIMTGLVGLAFYIVYQILAV